MLKEFSILWDMDTMPAPPYLRHDLNDGILTVQVGGEWKLGRPAPSGCRDAQRALEEPGLTALRLCAGDDLGAWDSSLISVLFHLARTARARGLPIHDADLPQGLSRLLTLTLAVPSKEGSERRAGEKGLLAAVGGMALRLPAVCSEVLSFIGDVACALARLCRGRTDMRRQDFIAAMHECGVGALPIISLTSMLFGLILAFVGAVQLTQFGAQIYVAGLVGIGMLRVMGAVTVGAVMSGRVGAAYAALIGTMQVNEEVDALATLGVSPMEFLVLPRMLALSLMVPLLTVYADVMGIAGGFVVGACMLDISPLEYLSATASMVSFRQGLIGLTYATVFGIIIALAGCYQGLRCGRSAAAVGMATTAAVVQSIVWIIVATAIITVICNVLGI